MSVLTLMNMKMLIIMCEEMNLSFALILTRLVTQILNGKIS